MQCPPLLFGNGPPLRDPAAWNVKSRTQQAVLCALSLVPGSASEAVIVGQLILVRGPSSSDKLLSSGIKLHGAVRVLHAGQHKAFRSRVVIEPDP